MVLNGRMLLAVSSLCLLAAACGSPTNPPPPQWTVENSSSSATASQKTGQAAPQTAATDTGGSSASLDALRTGQSTATSGPLKDVMFAFDRAELSDGARTTLKANAEWLRKNPSARVQIEGHCDERGAEDYNMALGAKRAQTAMDYLSTLGITETRLSTISYGEEVPACRDHSEDCWAKNRRARFIIVAGGPSS